LCFMRVRQEFILVRSRMKCKTGLSASEIQGFGLLVYSPFLDHDPPQAESNPVVPTPFREGVRRSRWSFFQNKYHDYSLSSS